MPSLTPASRTGVCRIDAASNCNRGGFACARARTGTTAATAVATKKRDIVILFHTTTTSAKVRENRISALERVFDPRRRGLQHASEFRLQFIHPLFHLPGDVAIAEMPLHAAADPRNILHFREIHLTEEARAGAERQQILAARIRQATHG